MKAIRGFAFISGIFLLLLLAMLGAFMVSFSTSQHHAAALDLQGGRAYRAARMGLEWAAVKICNGVGCASPLTACPVIPTPLDTAPDGFSVVVSCSMNTYQEAGPGGNITRYVFRVTSTASDGGGPGGGGHVERSVSALVEFPS